MVTMIDMDRLVQAYVAIRDARAARKAVFEREDALLEADQTTLRAVMLAHMNATGARNIATEHGTAYRSEKLKPSAADWGAVWDWMKQNDAFDMMEKRLKAKFIKDYMDEHNGSVPPGVNVHREFEVSVRRPSNASSSAAQENDDGD